MAALSPRVLALMHGPAFTGACVPALDTLAKHYDSELRRAVLHAIEWKHLIDEGLTPFALPHEWAEKWPGATPLFGATFFGITGMHMFHVFTGCIYLLVVAARVKKASHEDVEISGLYWHFVDLVWMFVFPLIYIMSVDVHHLLAAH